MQDTIHKLLTFNNATPSGSKLNKSQFNHITNIKQLNLPIKSSINAIWNHSLDKYSWIETNQLSVTVLKIGLSIRSKPPMWSPYTV